MATLVWQSERIEKMKITENSMLISKETGEVLAEDIPPNSVIKTPIEAKISKEKGWLPRKTDITSQICGDFYWSILNPEKAFYDDLRDEFLAKVIYLVTYIDYDSNKLVTAEGSEHKKRLMKKTDVERVMGLSEKHFRQFWKSVTAYGFVSEEKDGSLTVCDKFRKGELKLSKRENLRAVKIFTHSVRYMYEHTDNRSHKYLAYLFRLIPFISLRYNVLCTNPLEPDKTKVQKMTAKELCFRLGLDTSHQTRLINKLFTLSFVDKQGDKRSVINVLTNMKNDEKRNFITINPQFYAGYIEEQEMLDIVEKFALE